MLPSPFTGPEAPPCPGRRSVIRRDNKLATDLESDPRWFASARSLNSVRSRPDCQRDDILVKATARFDPNLGAHFSTYAGYWIKQSIRQALINTAATIRLPAQMMNRLTKRRRAEQARYRERGCAPTSGEVASVLGLSETHNSLLAKAHQARRIKLESDLAAGNGERSREEPRGRQQAPHPVMESNDDRRVLLQRMARLDDCERAILALWYGLEGELTPTHKDIRRRLGLSREWVRKIERRALRKLNDDQQGHACGSQDLRQRRRDRRHARRFHGVC